jgi:phosphoribosyl-AMP cyclohydrolase
MDLPSECHYNAVFGWRRAGFRCRPGARTEPLDVRQSENENMTEAPPTGPNFSKGKGLLPAIAQDAATGDVLMLAYMNQESYQETLKTRRAVYYSRSRQRLWRKGEESGNVQEVSAVFYDCDSDAILLKVNQIGQAACHTGRRSCFFHEVTDDGVQIVGDQLFDPEKVYGRR